MPISPYLGCPTKAQSRFGNNSIGLGKCNICSAKTPIKINKSGWPYYRCTCGNHPQIRGVAAANNVLKSVTHWHSPARAFINKAHVDLTGEKLIIRAIKEPITRVDHVEPPQAEIITEPDKAEKPRAKHVRRIGFFKNKELKNDG